MRKMVIGLAAFGLVGVGAGSVLVVHAVRGLNEDDQVCRRIKEHFAAIDSESPAVSSKRERESDLKSVAGDLGLTPEELRSLKRVDSEFEKSTCESYARETCARLLKANAK